MLPCIIFAMYRKSEKVPLRRAHFVGTSVVVTIDPIHVKRLGVDDMTFFIQKPIENGITLEMHRLDTNIERRVQDDKKWS